MSSSSDDMASEARKVICALLPVLFWAPHLVPSSLAPLQGASCFIPHLPNQNFGSQFHSTGSVSPALRALFCLPSPPAASNRRRDHFVPLKLKPRFSGSALNSATFCRKGSPEAGGIPAHSSQWGQAGNTEVTQLSSKAETQLSYNSPSKSKPAKGNKNSAFLHHGNS